jgi:hypothetical protein
MAGLEDDRRFAAAPMMLLRGFFAQNVAIGCAFGGFAVSILALEERFQTSRALAEMVLALVVLTMSLLAPAAYPMADMTTPVIIVVRMPRRTIIAPAAGARRLIVRTTSAKTISAKAREV